MTSTAPSRAGTARQRIIDAAVSLFFEHGAGGTSLQMIADRAEMTKAAVYYHFPAKEDIVLAVITPALEGVSQVSEAAVGTRSRSAALDILITGIIDHVIDNRRLAAVLWADPAIDQVLNSHPLLQDIGTRVHQQLAGPNPDIATLVRVSMFGASLRAAADPFLADLDVDVLREQMVDIARRLLGVRAPRSST